MLALYRFAAEGGEAVDALVAAGAVPAVVELVAAGAGHGGAHEAAEAMRHCLQTLMLLARASHAVAAAMVCELLVLGPLLAKHKRAEVALPGGCAIGSRPVAPRPLQRERCCRCRCRA